MTILSRNYQIDTDAQTGLSVITLSGRCTGDEAAGIERDCTRRYEMVTLPNAAGAILKSHDGTNPKVIEITPSTITTRKYKCVKVDGRVNPLAPAQPDGPYAGQTILRFMVRYQEVGGVA